jgi:polyhydroxyalkanoate synthesis regulator phasin
MERFWQSLAGHFQVSVQEMYNAVGDAASEALQPLVDDGKLSQERVDALVSRLREGKIAPFFMPHRRPGRAVIRFERKMLKAAADELGMEPRALLGEIVAGKTLGEVVEEKGGDADAVLSAMRDAADALIDQALANGRLTKDQADKVRERIHSFLDEHGLNLGAHYFLAPLRHPRRFVPHRPGKLAPQGSGGPGAGQVVPAAPAP